MNWVRRWIMVKGVRMFADRVSIKTIREWLAGDDPVVDILNGMSQAARQIKL